MMWSPRDIPTLPQSRYERTGKVVFELSMWTFDILEFVHYVTMSVLFLTRSLFLCAVGHVEVLKWKRRRFATHAIKGSFQEIV